MYMYTKYNIHIRNVEIKMFRFKLITHATDLNNFIEVLVPGMGKTSSAKS